MLGFKNEWVTVLSFHGQRKKDGRNAWLCRCKCGKKMLRTTWEINKGKPKSCGCNNWNGGGNKKTHPIKHGLKKHLVYHVWEGMKQRCYNVNNPRYHVYGGKGIKICDEWKNNPAKFYDWAINNNWAKDMTIDRVDNNKDYCPDNCRFITRSENGKKVFVDNPDLNRGINNHDAILTDDKVCEIKKMISLGERSCVIAKKMNVLNNVIYLIRSGKTWKHIKETNGRIKKVQKGRESAQEQS